MNGRDAFDVFVAISTYRVSMDDVEAALPEHQRWVAEHYTAGTVLVSGRQSPPRGGAMVFVARGRLGAEALLATDPFVRLGIAEYSLTEFVPSDGDRRSAHFTAFLDEHRCLDEAAAQPH